MKIAFYGPDPIRMQEWIANLKQEGLEFDVAQGSEQGSAAPAEARYAVVWLPDAAFFKRETSLEVVFNVGAGVDGILKLKSIPEHVDIVRLDDSEIGQKMSEYVLHAVAEITRHLGGYRDAAKANNWKPGPYTYFDDWPIGVMGLGTVGRQIAGFLSMLGYPVNGWSRSPRHVAGVNGFNGAGQMGAFLAASRIVINVLPLTPETENILNRHTFDQMRDGSFIINIGRGEHLNESDLLDSLNSGKLAGAVLDVFREEPLPAMHPFWTDTRIRITPHISGATNLKLAMRQIAGKIKAHQAGEPITGIVDKKMGY